VNAGARPRRPPRSRRVDVEQLDRVAGDRVGGDDDPVGAPHGEVAQPEAHAGAQVLRTALERDEVVQGDHLGDRRAHERAVDPGRVEDVGVARAVRLDELVAVGRLAQGGEQAARVAPDPAVVGGGAAVEGDLHAGSSASTRSAYASAPNRRAWTRAAAPISARRSRTARTARASAAGSPGATSRPVTPVVDGLGQAADPRGDDRRADRHRLGQDGPERLLARRRDEHVEVAQQARRAGDPAVMLDVLALAHRPCVPGIGPVGIVAHDDDPYVGPRRPDRRGGAGEVERALARLDAADEADHRPVAGRPRGRDVGRVELDGAEDDVRVEAVEPVGDRLRVGEHHVGGAPVARDAVDEVVHVQHGRPVAHGRQDPRRHAAVEVDDVGVPGQPPGPRNDASARAPARRSSPPTSSAAVASPRPGLCAQRRTRGA
jgi:hypothetical protein